MAIPQGAMLEVKVGYTVNTQKCYNVLHYAAYNAILGLLPLEEQDFVVSDLSGGGNGEFPGEFRKVMGQNVVLDELTCQFIWPTRYRVSRETFTFSGDIAVDCEAQNLQASITKKGDLGNRHNIGGVRVGGMPSSAYENGLLTAGHITLLTALKNYLATDITLSDGVSTLVPVIINKTKTVVDGKDKYVISGWSLITNWAIEDELRTQRPRTVGRGI